jgi:hypothetical protein
MTYLSYVWLGLLSFLLLTSVAFTQEVANTVIFTPTEIPISAPELPNPLRGFFDWYGAGVKVPDLQYPEYYKRYMWDELETSKGSYDFSVIKNDLAIAQANRQKFAFRIMAVNSFHHDQVGVPNYLTKEVPGSFCDYQTGYSKSESERDRIWVPDWNNRVFLTRAAVLIKSLGQEFDGNPAIAYYDMGIYGHWGEWHLYPFTNCSGAEEASQATKREIVDMQLTAFPKSRIIMNSGAGNSDSFAYTLNKSPRIGIRIDSFNWPWFDQQLEANPVKKALVQSRWKTAPIIVEFGGSFSQNDSQDFSLARSQVSRWHLASLANGNSYDWTSFTPTQKDNFLLAGKLSGYRFVPQEFRYPKIVANNSIKISSKWSNKGVTPLYEPFIVRYTLSLKGKNIISWYGDSQLDLQTLLPTLNPQGVDIPKTITDNFTLPPDLAAGIYTLKLSVLDPTKYRPNLSFAIEGRSNDGSYSLGEVIVP